MTAAPIRILSTRPLEGSLIETAATYGMTVYAHPFISIEPLTGKDVRNKVGWIAGNDTTVIFTSRNAVESVVGLLERRPVWRIFCTGHATRRLAEEHFGAGSIAGVADSAAELAEKIVSASGNLQKRRIWPFRKAASGAVVFFCGDQRREELPKRLSDQGIEVEEVIVYKTIPAPKRIEADYDGILFFSPSAVNSFFSVNTLPPGITLFAIGDTTADTIRSKCPNPIYVGESPDTELFIRDIIAYYKTKSNNEP